MTTRSAIVQAAKGLLGSAEMRRLRFRPDYLLELQKLEAEGLARTLPDGTAALSFLGRERFNAEIEFR